jgi:hypothetical protein
VRVPTVPVSGTLYVDDKPYGPVMLILTPTTKDANHPSVSAEVAEDGSFSLSTYSAADEDPDGAPPGDYTVAFSFDVMNPAKQRPGITATSNQVTVPESDDDVTLDIKLESTGKETNPMQAMQNPNRTMSPSQMMKPR